MISVKNSYEIAYNGTENECRFELYADTAADLQSLTHIDGIKIQMGSECTDIATSGKYLLNGSGVWVLQPSANVWDNVYTKTQIDTMINAIYPTMMYYHTALESANGSITFYTLGTPVGSLTIYGNGQQTGTPTPDNPVMPTFCGKMVGADWTIPITCAGQTVPVYLGEVQTVRRVRKLVLDGTETVSFNAKSETRGRFAVTIPLPSDGTTAASNVISTHFATLDSTDKILLYTGVCMRTTGRDIVLAMSYSEASVVAPTDATMLQNAVKSYLAAQYAAGTPVTVWYVLANEQTGIVNEPLCKISDYADELHIADADVSIPTVSGENTLTVDTDLPPSKIVISGE